MDTQVDNEVRRLRACNAFVGEWFDRDHRLPAHRLTALSDPARIRGLMRSLLPQTALVALTALAHGGLIGTAMAVHLAQHEHDELGHDRSAAIAYIVHGHDHGPGTPDHEHSIVYAKPAPQHLKRFDLPDPPSSASLALLMPEPRFSLSLRRAPELCGPSPPLLHRSLIALRI